ncbi:MAG: TlpA family protein disulfide reductase [Alphaproteobacteria bacterium]|nr:TlpA family protein disulfide reductase [Alphaproteobacteria bacterium]
MNIVVRVIAAAAAFGMATGAMAAKAKVGEPAPGFSLVTWDKRKVSLAELKGKVVVINHWATWCGPCKAEMPMMSGFHRKFQDRGFEIFGVTTEDSVPEYMLKKLASVLSYPLVHRFSSSAYPILNAVPTSYVIDRKGVVRYAKAGSFDGKEFADLILPLLNEPAPAVSGQTH